MHMLSGILKGILQTQQIKQAPPAPVPAPQEQGGPGPVRLRLPKKTPESSPPEAATFKRLLDQVKFSGAAGCVLAAETLLARSRPSHDSTWRIASLRERPAT